MKKLLLFLLGVAALPLHAQSPGGVNGADLWYKAVPPHQTFRGFTAGRTSPAIPWL